MTSPLPGPLGMKPDQPDLIDERPFRTLGLSLAVIAVFFLLGFVPLVPAIFVGILALEKHPTSPAESEFWLGPVFAVAVIVTCVLARARAKSETQCFLRSASTDSYQNQGRTCQRSRPY